jgi:hypothetical protein
MKYSENRIRKVIRKILLESYGNKSKNLLSEIKLRKFKADLVGSKISNEYYEEHIFNSKKNKIRKPFDDSDYLQVLYNSINDEQGHGIEEFIDFYTYFANYMRMQERDPNSLEEDLGAGENVSLIGKLDKGNVSATLDDLISFNQARIATGKGNKIDTIKLYQNVLNTGGKHFESIIENSEWIVCYPKTITGSKALSRSFWDGSKLQIDETFHSSSGRGEKIGKMPWCTNADGDANRFISYQGKANLHLYYCIKKQTENQEKPDRKLSIGFKKENGKAILIHKLLKDKLANLGATVDSNNKILKEKDVYDYLGKDIVNKLFEDVSREDKEDLDLISYYSSFTFKVYKKERITNNHIIEDFAQEFKYISMHSYEADKIVLFSSKDENVSINQHCFNMFYNILRIKNENYKKILKNIDNQKILKLKNALTAVYIEENNPKRLQVIAKLTDRQDLIERFTNSENDKIRLAVSENKNISEDLINLLLKDDSLEVKCSLINNFKVDTETKHKLIEEDLRMIEYSENVRDFILKSPSSKENLIIKLFHILTSKKHLQPINYHYSLASNPNTPESILKEIFRYSIDSGNTNVVMQLFFHPRFNDEIIIENLEEISGYNDLLQMLVRTPNSSSKVLERILEINEIYLQHSGRVKQETWVLIRFMMDNPNMTPELLGRSLNALELAGYDIQSSLNYLTKYTINKLFELDEWKWKLKNEYSMTYSKIDKEKREAYEKRIKSLPRS